MRVLITGATGLIGKEIVKRCHINNIDVNYLTTSKSKIEHTKGYQGFYWNITNKELDINCFNGVDAIIHLAGAAISKRWTPSYKKEIINSRVESTQLLIDSLKGESHTIKHVIASSAIGIYPDSITHYYDETFKDFDDTFLSEVVTKWEQSVDGFSKLNMLVSKVRTGLALSEKGGALPKMAKPIKFGLGASFGTGEQWQSWIHLDDLANMYLYILTYTLEGIYNGVSPNPVTNKELTKSIAKILDKPLFLPNIPKVAMKLVLGEMHTLLFDSQRVSSKKIEDKGFYFEYHHLQPALDDLLG
ncbi:TIGR01777 family oxidoreductase [Confluentibacter flavum]|uniref:TIGR01777 family protein n=1 Tax=Confluentibacter flavum TaxID=1909700 RepID=A0A2N3HMR7_9FLAO|nr:TIGR01777 family oxidoreductase [Confluentibacter flavum]PKQ46225.1 TIGR01777 family protein [Confluentibacter flavum]